jgi:hypothetical protein
MSPEAKKELEQHVQAISKLLYENADKSKLSTLSEIEVMVRQQIQEQVSPQIGSFLSKILQMPLQDTLEP